jgi:hypothetical protein
VSLAGNVSLLSSPEVLTACYAPFMGYLKATVQSEDRRAGLEAIQFSKLKVSSLTPLC